MTAASIATAPGLRPVLEIALGDSRIPIGSSRWGTSDAWDDGGVWAGGIGQEPTWIDVSCYVHTVELNAGRDRSIDRWQVGNANVTLNNSNGWADLKPPSDDPTILEVRPGRPLRFGASLDDAPTVWLFHGLIDGVIPAYDPELHDTVTVDAVDAKGEVGKVAIAAVDEPGVGAGETATQRIERVLNEARWSATARDLAPSPYPLRATTLGSQAVDLIDIAADSVGGAVYGDTAGRVAFRTGNWQIWNPDTPPDGTIGNERFPDPIVEGPEPVAFGDDPVTWGDTYHTDSVPVPVLEHRARVTWFGNRVIFNHIDVPTDVCPTGWEISFELIDIATRVLVGRTGEEPIVLDDEPNQARYGVETFTRTDLECVDDTVLARQAVRLSRTLSADYMPNIAAVSIHAATSRLARDLCVTVDPTLPSRYRCVLVTSDGRTVFNRQFFAVGVQHRVTPEEWTTRIALDDAAPYAAVGQLWDAGRWDTDEWAVDPFELLVTTLPIGAST